MEAPLQGCTEEFSLAQAAEQDKNKREQNMIGG
jgi:hypothetical protein